LNIITLNFFLRINLRALIDLIGIILSATSCSLLILEPSQPLLGANPKGILVATVQSCTHSF